jgi:hypothetical protein
MRGTRLNTGIRRRQAKPAPNAKRINGPKLFAAIGPVKNSPLTEDSKRVDRSLTDVLSIAAIYRDNQVATGWAHRPEIGGQRPMLMSELAG